MRSRSSWFLLVAIPLLLAVGVALFFLRDNFANAFWDTNRALLFPRFALIDQAGNYVVSDRGDRRIMSLAPDGTLRWQVFGESRDERGFYTVSWLDSDAQGRVWILNSILDPLTNNTLRLELKSIDAAGRISPPVWKRDARAEEQVGLGRLPFMLSYANDAVYYFIGDGEEKYAMHRISLVSGADQELGLFTGLNLFDFTSIVVLPDESVFFLDTLGRILAWNPETQSTRPVFVNDSKLFHVPSWMVSDGKTGFLLLDSKRSIMAVASDGQARTLVQAPVFGWYPSSLLHPVKGKLAVADERSQGLWLVDTVTGTAQSGPSAGRLAGAELLAFWLFWALVLVEGLLALGVLTVLIMWNFNKRSPLLVKQLVVFVPIVLLSCGGIAWWVYGTMYQKLSDETDNRLLAWSALGRNLVSGDDLDSINPIRDVQGTIIESPEFTRLTTGMTTVTGGNIDPWNSNVFDYIYYKRGKEWFVFDQYGYFERYLPRPGFEEVLDTGIPRVIRYQDAFSSWISGFAPITRADGTIAGLFEITIDANLFTELRTNFWNGLARALAVVIALLALFSSAYTWWLLQSIRSLSRGAVRVREGDYSAQVVIHSRDEIEDLGLAFNQMTDEIKGQIDKVTRLNLANAKFVPNQFLAFLGKNSILDIKLGDQTQREMTVLFSDIRSFTTLSETMSPTENFDFINTYLRVMGPLIRENQGFIDKYIGDAIMALFPGGPADAIKAALAMSKGLDGFNSTAGFGDIHIGIGLHVGNLMLGIVGEEMRYDGTVISDAVNLASRLESLTKYYGVDILVSGAVLERLGAEPGIDYRFLDCVSVRGKSASVMMYEVIAPNDPLRDQKILHQPRYLMAYDLYAAGRLADAAQAYTELARLCPGDSLPGIFLGRIRNLENQGVPHGWQGVTVLAQK